MSMQNDIYNIIKGTSYEYIRENVHKYLNKPETINITIESYIDYIDQYAKSCALLLDILEDSIGEMRARSKYSISKSFNDNDIMHELIFSTEFNDKNYYLTRWKNQKYELPFDFIKRLMANKGYIIEVDSDGYREDLYAPWICVYTLKITVL